jgi:hypothetical protein
MDGSRRPISNALASNGALNVHRRKNPMSKGLHRPDHAIADHAIAVPAEEFDLGREHRPHRHSTRAGARL